MTFEKLQGCNQNVGRGIWDLQDLFWSTWHIRVRISTVRSAPASKDLWISLHSFQVFTLSLALNRRKLLLMVLSMALLNEPSQDYHQPHSWHYKGVVHGKASGAAPQRCFSIPRPSPTPLTCSWMSRSSPAVSTFGWMEGSSSSVTTHIHHTVRDVWFSWVWKISPCVFISVGLICGALLCGSQVLFRRKCYCNWLLLAHKLDISKKFKAIWN